MGAAVGVRRPCEGHCNGPWFAPEHETHPQRESRELAAKLACAGCPAEIECLASALGARDHRTEVVLGGLNGGERYEVIELLDRAKAREEADG